MTNRLFQRLLDRFPWLGWYAWAQVRRGAYHRDGAHVIGLPHPTDTTRQGT